MADGTNQKSATRIGELFVSRAGADKEIAILIARILRGAGYTTFLQDEDFGYASFMARMEEGFAKIDDGGRVVALLSRAYQASDYSMKEAQYPLTGDPFNKKQRLIVLRIEDCAPTGFLKDIPYIDLVPLLHDADAFARAVRGSIGKTAPDADFSALYRRAPTQIPHPHIHSGLAGRATLTETRSAAIHGWRGGGKSVMPMFRKYILIFSALILMIMASIYVFEFSLPKVGGFTTKSLSEASILGAFGVKFGEKLVLNNPNKREKHIEYRIIPREKSSYFETYYTLTTVTSNRILNIIGLSAPMKEAATCRQKAIELMLLLKRKYPSFKTYPITQDDYIYDYGLQENSEKSRTFVELTCMGLQRILNKCVFLNISMDQFPKRYYGNEAYVMLLNDEFFVGSCLKNNDPSVVLMIRYGDNHYVELANEEYDKREAQKLSKDGKGKGI